MKTSSHAIGRLVGTAAVNVLGFATLGAALLFVWASLSARSATWIEQSLTPEMVETYMPMLNPILGLQSIKLLNAGHIYLIGILFATLALVTIVDGILEMVVEYVADRAMISTSLVAEACNGDYDSAINNAGYSTKIKYAGAPAPAKAKK
eukprot:GILI01030133.1.p1 GENE.GILI01030133.1~~GILI01030133.1.p1  ORF type:complete len:163 (+),score=33.22 GILI01030133.1:40-489(+)